MRDLRSRISPASLIDPATLAADNTPVAVDLLGFGSAVIVLSVGAGGITFTGTNKIEFVLTHSDDNVTYTNVTDADVQGVTVVSGGVVRSLTTAKAAADVTKIGYVGTKRYLKLQAVFTGTHGTGTGIAATVVRGRAAQEPA